MRRLTIPPLALVALLGVSSWFVTSTLLAQARRGAIVPAMTKGRIAKQNPPGPPANSIAIKPTASFTSDKMTATVKGGVVTVDMAATISDSRGKKSYMWALIVWSQDFDDVISAVSYDHQIFSVRPGVEAKPTFRETFQLPHGSYVVEVRLFELPPDANPAQLDITAPVNPKILLSASERVTVSR
jgi:hypothetical protein